MAWTVDSAGWDEKGSAQYVLIGEKEAKASHCRLISAAPDLLEALEGLLIQRFEFSGPVANAMHLWDAARAAIAKAKGEPSSPHPPADEIDDLLYAKQLSELP